MIFRKEGDASGGVRATRSVEELSPGESVWELVAARAEAHPDRVAVVDGDLEIDYRRLIQRARAVAGELAARGVAPGFRVAVCMSRSWELVAILAGILRAGCAYVPLDPAYPRRRLRAMVEHAGVAAAIVDREQRVALCAGAGEILRLSEIGEGPAPGGPRPAPQDLAYVLYTSGSTGRPKGVAVEHRAVVSLSRSMRWLLDDDELSGVLAATSVCFDPSVMEILGTLCLGGTVVLAKDVLDLLTMPSAPRVRTCVMVPSAMQALLAAGRLPGGIRCLVFGGEVLKPSLVDRLNALEPRPRVVNVYGPTEDTVFSTVKEVPVGADEITIGKAVPGSRAYVLDASLEPMPVGTPGELYLAGDQLARGYLHDDERTRERFLTPDPGGAIAEERLYRTGDLGRLRDDGEIEFLGRVDQQVKIRGFRIELAEIEACLESMAGVAGAAAAVVEGAAGQGMLAAYVVSPEPGVTRRAVRDHVAERLPAYMVPQVVVPLDELPLLPNGKLDRKALRKPDLAAGAAFAPATGSSSPSPLEVEDLLATVRAEIASLLGLATGAAVPPDALLDDLGLDSLSSLELGARLAAATGSDLPVTQLMAGRTPADLAERLATARGGGDSKEGAPSTEPPAGRGQGDPPRDTLGRFQEQLRACHPLFLAAKLPSWSVNDKGVLVRELKSLVSRAGRDPYSKLVRSGSASRGLVADAVTDDEREAIIWTTNLYLGLNRDREVQAAARSAVERFGTGMGTSAAASGVTDLHLEFEQAFAELVGKPAACLFPTGFTANLGVVASLLGENDVIVMDQLCHASIVDGARLCGARLRTFRHNDAADLESVLALEASPYRTILVVLEGVYSMGEGAAPVEEIVAVAKGFDALVLVDEAHSFGFYGPRGAGLCAERGVSDQVDFIMTTLSKALGSLGGVVAAREEHVALLKASARAYIFQASASPADIAAALAALRRLRSDDSLRERLWDTTAYMRRRFSAAGYDLGDGDGPIVTPHFADKDKLFAIVHGLLDRGVHTAAVTYPIVESGRGRLRFICSAAHTRDDVDRTLEALIAVEREVDAAKSQGATAAEISWLGRADVEAWARDLASDLQRATTTDAERRPRLAISFALADEKPAITLRIDGGGVQLYGVAGEASGAVAESAPTVAPEQESPTQRLPSCSLRLTDARDVATLCAGDIAGLLECLLDGTCRVQGQAEPLLWLIGRLADRRRPSKAQPLAAAVR